MNRKHEIKWQEGQTFHCYVMTMNQLNFLIKDKGLNTGTYTHIIVYTHTHKSDDTPVTGYSLKT